MGKTIGNDVPTNLWEEPTWQQPGAEMGQAQPQLGLRLANVEIEHFIVEIEHFIMEIHHFVIKKILIRIHNRDKYSWIKKIINVTFPGMDWGKFRLKTISA